MKKSQIKNKTKYKIVYLEWDDAVAAPAGWVDDLDDWKKTSSYIISEVGFLLEENDEEIFLAGFIKPEDKNTIERQGGVRRIPKGWIQKKIIF